MQGRPILAALVAGVAFVATASGASNVPGTAALKAPGGTSVKLPPEATVPERTFTPQVVKPGSQPVSTDGQRDQGNACSFPYRFWAYHDLTPTPRANGDVSLHIIRVVSFQTLNGRRTVFETDNFHVLIHHTHPLKNWKITGRYGEWYLNAKRVWLESGVLSATPIPGGGETVVDPHPRPMSRRPDLCKILSS